MSHAIDYINGFESLINEYKQDGYPSSPEAIYTNTTLKLNGFKSDSVTGSEGFVSDIAKKFWDAILAIYNWFKSLFKSSEERKLDKFEKELKETLAQILKIDPDGEIFNRIANKAYSVGCENFIRKVSFPDLRIEGGHLTNVTVPENLPKFIIRGCDELNAKLDASKITNSTLLSSYLFVIRTTANELLKTEFYVKFGGKVVTGTPNELPNCVGNALETIIKLRRRCDELVTTSLSIMKNRGDDFDSPVFREYSKFLANIIIYISKIQNVFIKQAIEVISLIGQDPVFKGVNFGPLITRAEKELVRDVTVDNLSK